MPQQRSLVGAQEEAPDGWHTIRIPDPDQLGPRRGLPAERIDHDAMQAWCETNCSGGWTVRQTETAGTHYLFEEHADATAFALGFFPFKCT